MLTTIKDGNTVVFNVKPPQTRGTTKRASSGCYCFVIDISGRHLNTPTMLLTAPTPSPRLPRDLT